MTTVAKSALTYSSVSVVSEQSFISWKSGRFKSITGFYFKAPVSSPAPTGLSGIYPWIEAWETIIQTELS